MGDWRENIRSKEAGAELAQAVAGGAGTHDVVVDIGGNGSYTGRDISKPVVE